MDNQTFLEVRGIPCREVDNDKFCAELFAPLSIYENWKKSSGGIPSEDDLFYGYVEDEQFYAMTDDEFEEMVNDIFD